LLSKQMRKQRLNGSNPRDSALGRNANGKKQVGQSE